jgi:hypothetical protein
MEKKIFKDFDFTDFWEDSDYALQEYVNDAPSDELIQSIETELRYKLPASYVELMKLHNGGIPTKNCFPTTESTSWAEDHIAITGIMGIGRNKTYSLCGHLGSKFMIEEWGYPATGVFICDCPSAGHDMVMLDYSKCGRNGEPEVVHIDQELDFKKTFLAKDFETFIRGLVSEEVYDTSEEDLIDTLERIKTGRFSDVLQAYFKKEKTTNFDTVLRNLFTTLTKEKGYFSLHADPLSHLAYDIQFYLLTLNKKIRTKEDFVRQYLPMVAMSNNEISTGGYANFFEDWFDEKLKNKEITKGIFSGLNFTDEYKQQLFDKIKQYE